MSPYLIHFTSGETDQHAFETLQKIIDDRRLLAGTRMIKGQHPCVCFSEAPLGLLEGGLVSERAYSRYRLFGILFEKQWVFAMGGRPVIYESDDEYDNLPSSHQWRHVKYEPNSEDPVDFTWEREWRIQCDFLDFTPENASLVVPDSAWAKHLVDAHEHEQHYLVMQYSTIFDEVTAEMYRESWQWTVYPLRAD